MTPGHVLVTGGAGYIGSHTCLALLQAGWRVTVADNLSTGSREALRRVEQLTGLPLALAQVDVRDAAAVQALLEAHDFDAVVHFAALKVLSESLRDPLSYSDHNVHGLTVLLQAMRRANVRSLVFSSSAAVYGVPDSVPIREDAPLLGVNPYAVTKRIGEEMLGHLVASEPGWRAVSLRYFNPVGAHESGLLGESPAATPSNLMPVICDVALGRRAELPVFGTDYPTRDGSCIRDFIHVMDLAQGHVRALHWMAEQPAPQCVAVNLGTGRGHSVLEMVQAFQAANGVAVPYRVVARRPGEVADCHADARLAQSLLGWQAERGLAAMCTDAWRWSQSHPGGFARAGSKAAAV